MYLAFYDWDVSKVHGFNLCFKEFNKIINYASIKEAHLDKLSVVKVFNLYNVAFCPGCNRPT